MAPRVASAASTLPTAPGCTRASPSQYYVSKELCEVNKPAGEMCVPR